MVTSRANFKVLVSQHISGMA